MQYRTDNIEEDTKYYKKISGLNDKSGNKDVEHGNSHIRKCKFFLFPRSYHLPQLFWLVTSQQFWEQVDQKNIVGLGEEYAYKHDLKLFDYSIEAYLERLDVNL